MSAKNLFDGQTEDGNSAVVIWKGGEGKLWANGDFGAGTLTVQYSLDGTNYFNLDVSGWGQELTEAAIADFKMGPCKLRATLTGATAADLDAGVLPVR